jgi:hypothetical protein
MSSSFLNMNTQRAVGALALLAASPMALAQSWVLDPRVEVSAIYDDNFRLTDQPGQEIEVTGGALDAALTARRETQAALFAVTPRIRSTLFPDESSEESTDYFLTLEGEKRTQRTTSKVDLRFADESVVTSELLAADFPGVDLGESVSGDAGRVSVRNRRRLIALAPSVLFDWTERRHLTFDLHAVDAEYDSLQFEQVGYTDYGAGAAIGWNVSQRSLISVGLRGSRYSPEGASEDTTTYGVVAEWRTAASQVMDFYFRAGSNRSERDATATSADVSATTFNGGVGVAWNLQTTRIVLDALRSTVPSSAGAVVDRDELRFRVSRAFQPRVSGYVALRGIRTEGVDEAVAPIRDREYATGSAGLEWRVSRQISLAGEYEYKWQEFEDEPNDATSNGVTLSIIYEPRRLD